MGAQTFEICGGQACAGVYVCGRSLCVVLEARPQGGSGCRGSRLVTATVTFNKTNCLIEFSGDAELRMNLPGNFAESKRRLSAESFLLCLHNLPEGEVQINGGDGKLFLRSGNLLVVNAEMEPEKNSQL